MKKMFYGVALVCLLYAFPTTAENVILMIGDGMGERHLKCAGQDKPLYIPTLPVKGMVRTKSANKTITDSAAAATAYSCGKKTNNHFLGKLPDETDCLTIAEELVTQDFSVGIYSTDYSTGATPSAFYAHVTDRKNNKKIAEYKKKASSSMDIAVPVKKISAVTLPKLNKLSAEPGKKGFFAMFEGAKIDTESHRNNIEKMKQELYDFDDAVMKAVRFAYKNPDTTLIVLADHETGGLNDNCQYTTKKHTSQDIPLYAYGKHADLFEGVQDNTEIYQKIKKILLP